MALKRKAVVNRNKSQLWLASLVEGKSQIWGFESSHQFMARHHQEKARMNQILKAVYVFLTYLWQSPLLDSEHVQMEWKFCLPLNGKTHHKILGDDGLKAFKNTYFGHFLDVKSMIFHSAIVHSSLVRVLKCDDLDVLEFKFREIGARFDHNAFNLVISLKFSQFPSLLEMQVVLLAGDKRKSVNRDHFKIMRNSELRERYSWSLSYDVTSNHCYPVHNRLYLTAQEKKEACITSFFKIIVYRSCDSPSSVVEDVDETTMDASLVTAPHPNRHIPTAIASTTHTPSLTTPYATFEDVVLLKNKLDDLNKKAQLIKKRMHYRFEAHATMMQNKYIHPSERSPITSCERFMFPSIMEINIGVQLKLIYCGDKSHCMIIVLVRVVIDSRFTMLSCLFSYMLAASGFYA
ncbi:hypothetical protein FNV43_RR27213 [Rhamnella rubrinervis]|uniref:Uncharacterized protein n=1 Tax=Rhamnella rubrinervis TaxID=2594499 RepID=A0A8K0DP08_9ROSA|nr:hypothetical protein FNV43_RR27213 [Rhamnella rubrinervis]